ncbi:DedA family protein [Halovulum dunhuangense]|uniref:DedA family protein n=1 Tax=Halovulum dunhuangense TaxID=1505036 RepID=A0A849L1W7_9RHOB|nr:DedA family protein [Halovulum dunhuangense]
MSEELLELVPDLGPPLLALVVALAALGLPLPATLALVMSGALAAAGEMDLAAVLAAAFLGAVAGDHAGYALGRLSRGSLRRWLTANRRRAEGLRRAEAAVQRHGMAAVFLSRWLLAPLGPPTNIAAGAAALPLARFTAADLAGEVVWVGLYAGLGYAFSGSIAGLVTLAGDLVWLAFSLGAAMWLGARLLTALRR